MKKYLRSMTKVASRTVCDFIQTAPDNNSAAVAARDKAKEWRKHWTKHRSNFAHREAFGVDQRRE